MLGLVATAILGSALAALQQVEDASSATAEFLFEQGERLARSGDLVEATSAFERALSLREQELGPEHPDLASPMAALGALHLAASDPDAAGPLLERALSIQETALGSTHRRVGRTAQLLGVQRTLTGRHAEAEQILLWALSILEHELGPEHRDVGRTLGHLARSRTHQGRLPQAKAAAERSVRVLEGALGADHIELAAVLVDFGRSLSDLARHGEARTQLERALSIYETADDPDGRARVLAELGQVLMELGDIKAARGCYERALSLREESPDPERAVIAKLRSLLGVTAHREGRVDTARRLHESALQELEAAVEPDDPRIATSLTELGGLLLETGDVSGARTLFERAWAIRSTSLPPDHPTLAVASNNLAVALLSSGEYADARALWERARPALHDALGPTHPRVTLVDKNLALLRLAEGDPHGAHADLVALAARNLHQVAAQLATTSEREGLQYIRSLDGELDALLCPDLLDGPDAVIDAYEMILAWKSQVLRALQRGRGRLRRDLTPGQIARLDELGRTTATLSRVAAGWSRIASGLPGRRMLASREELEGLVTARRRLERELLEAPLARPQEAPSWEQLRDALPPATALVDIFLQRVLVPDRTNGLLLRNPQDGHHLVAWITRPKAAQPVRVDLGPSRAIATEALAGGPAVGDRGDSLVRVPARGERLRGLVWDPIAPHLEGVETVFFSPDGILAVVSMGALRDRAGRFLVEDRGFVYLTDPTLITRRDEPVAGERRLVVMGDADFDALADPSAPAPDENAGDTGTAAQADAGELSWLDRYNARLEELKPGRATPERSAAQATPRLGRFAPLTGTAAEAQTVLRLHQQQDPSAPRILLTGAEATEEALVRWAPTASTLHLATHGYCDSNVFKQPAGAIRLSLLDDDFPGLLSGIVCAGANFERHASLADGRLTAEEIGWLDLAHVDLVVLSACDTGVGRAEVAAEGHIGLRRAFLVAGAHTVISSLWAVPDEDTVAFMERFYRHHWKGGLGKHEALRQAQLETLADNRERSGLPGVETWGAFVLDGDWR